MSSFPPLDANSSVSSQKWTWIATLIITAATGAVPAFVDLVEHWQTPRSPGLAPWALLSLAITALELAYVMYLAQFPQSAAFRLVALTLLALAMAYALLLGLSLFSGTEGRVVGWLGLSGMLNATRLWCLVMTCLTTITALAVGHHWGRSSG